MNYFAIKITTLDGEKPESFNFLVKAVSYGRAEEMGYEIAESYNYKDFKLESVVKKQIKEVHKSVEGECQMWLASYEFGLEAKPDKSNILVSSPDLVSAVQLAFAFLDPLATGLFLKDIKFQDFVEFLKDEEEVNEEEFEPVMEGFSL